MRLPICIMLLSTLMAGAQTVGKGPNFYSREKEAALGASLAQNLQRTTIPLNSPDALDYVQRVGAKLAAELPEPRFTYTFVLIASDESNALHEPLSFPGGYIFVPASLFLAAQDESEFAGMLAHAMSHIAARHGTRLATRAELSQLITVPLNFYPGWAGFGARQTPATIVPISFLQTSRAYEREADLLAVRFMSDAGYDPQALVRYFTRVWPNDLPGTTARIFSPTDSRDTRIAAIQAAIQQLPAVNPTYEFLRIQQEIRTLPR